MTPEERLTELRVWRMINEALDKYDIGNCKRHEENTKKLDKLYWGIMVTAVGAVGALIVEIIRIATKG